MDTDLKFKCDCGAVQGRVSGVTPKTVTHVVCHCVDCRTAARHLNRSDCLDSRGGTALFQTGAWRIHIDQGAESLALMRLSPKGLMRWYCAKCKTPIANTLEANKFSFGSITTATLDDRGMAQIGPLIARNASKSATGEGEPLKDFGLGKSIIRFLSRAIRARISGKSKISPFFKDGVPIAEPYILSLEERNAAREGGAS